MLWRRRASANDRKIASLEDEHIRRGIHRAQGAVEIERRFLELAGEPLRGHNLDDVAGADVFLGLRHDLLKGQTNPEAENEFYRLLDGTIRGIGEDC